MLPEHARSYTRNDRLKDLNKREQIKRLRASRSRHFFIESRLNACVALTHQVSALLSHRFRNLETATLSCLRFQNVLKIGHAPSNRDVKGTDQILKVIQDLQSSHGTRFEFHLIEKCTFTMK